MSIGPVGLQVIVNSATAIKKFENTDFKHSELLNGQFQQKLKEETTQIQSKVLESNKSEKTKDNKNQKNQKKTYKTKLSGDKKTEQDKNTERLSSVSMFDMQI